MSVLTPNRRKSKTDSDPDRAKYPGVRAAVDGNTAVILCERESTDAAGASSAAGTFDIEHLSGVTLERGIVVSGLLVPEPSTSCLASMGALAALLTRRWRRARSAG